MTGAALGLLTGGLLSSLLKPSVGMRGYGMPAKKSVGYPAYPYRGYGYPGYYGHGYSYPYPYPVYPYPYYG